MRVYFVWGAKVSLCGNLSAGHDVKNSSCKTKFYDGLFGDFFDHLRQTKKKQSVVQATTFITLQIRRQSNLAISEKSSNLKVSCP